MKPKQRKNGKEPSPSNPKGAGRPPKNLGGDDPSRQTNAPPPPSSADPAVVAKEIKKAKTIKVTPQLAEELGGQIAMAEAIPYAVVARAKEDDRWMLAAEEVEMLKRVWTTAILVYADEIGKWIPLVALISANSAPLIARMMMGEKEKPAPGAGETTAADRKKAKAA